MMPSASGARLAGDDFQHFFTWLHALRLLRKGEGFAKIEFEVDDVGNVDDLVLHRREGPPTYHQIKFARDQRELLTAEWFTTPLRSGGRSLLQQFHASYDRLSREGVPPDMALYTNRQLGGGDPIFACLDGVSDRLTPRLRDAKAGSDAGRARAAWARHLDVPEEELLALLDQLQIKAGKASLDELRESCGVLAEAVGLRGDPEAADLGCAEIRRLIIDGCRELDAEAVREIVRAKGLMAQARRGSLLIQGIARHPFPESATANVDWVALYAGGEPRERRQVRDPDSWQRMREELHEAVEAIRREGYSEVLVEGAFRLSTAFLAGTELSDVAGFGAAIRTRESGLWETSADPATTSVTADRHELGRGDELAIGLSVTGDLSADALNYIESAELPISAFVNLTPADGSGRRALRGPDEARGFADAAFDRIRELTRDHTGTLHLFQFGPAGAGLMLGHLWNRVPTTQLYDDLGPGRGYTPTFVLPA
jgi:hypothetical protein